MRRSSTGIPCCFAFEASDTSSQGRKNADGYGMIYGQKDVIGIVVERLKVVSKTSLALSAGAFILNVFDHCRPRFSLSSYEHENKAYRTPSFAFFLSFGAVVAAEIVRFRLLRHALFFFDITCLVPDIPFEDKTAKGRSTII